MYPSDDCILFADEPGPIDAGADSLANDRLGGFNLTVDGHGEAVNFMKKFKLPMLVTGGEPHPFWESSRYLGYCEHVIWGFGSQKGVLNMAVLWAQVLSLHGVQAAHLFWFLHVWCECVNVIVKLALQ